jgi:2-polyprenyl-3-methyl-5-hydroxy-6-metoxy-1,4-benzoquinol methylase
MNAAAGVRVERGIDEYFELTRPELRALVPLAARRVLDVGCGAGGLGAALKADRGCEVVGLEGFPEAVALAGARLDAVLEIDLDELDALPAAAGSFDAMVFGDVLEHLRNPGRLLGALLPALAEDGALVFSIPNVRHWSVVCPLLVNDAWEYTDAGLLDRTHIHFFTLREFVALLADLGLEATHVGVNDHLPLPDRLRPFVDLAAAFGADAEQAAFGLGAYQYLIVARRHPRSEPKPFVSVAFLDELLSAPEMLHEYARAFDGRADATLAVLAPGEDPDALALAFEPVAVALGLDRPGSADIVVLTDPDDLADVADALFTRVRRDAAYAGVPHVGDAGALAATSRR